MQSDTLRGMRTGWQRWRRPPAAIRRRALAVGLTLIFVWYMATVLFWATRPLSDRLDVGTDYSQSPPTVLTEHVSCLTLFDSEPRRIVRALPALPAQPEGKPALAYPRPPCVSVYHQARVLFGVDTALVVVATAGIGAWTWRRPTESRDDAGSIRRSSDLRSESIR
jgi:hypothetical protein